MAIRLNYQLSMFGNYSIPPTPENVMALMNAINEATDMIFLPNLISGQQVEIPTRRITLITNLGYTTQDQKYNIAILNDRIDVGYNRVDDNALSITEFYNFAVKAMTAIIKSEKLKSYRLAANIQVLENDLSESEIIELGKKVIVSPDFYKNKSFVEWSTRINAKSDIKINDVNEELNTILTIATAAGVPNQDTVLIYHLDINTLSELKDLRFDENSLSDFVNGAGFVVEEILNDIEKLVNNER